MNNKNLIWIPVILGVILVLGTIALFAIPKNTQKAGNSLASSSVEKDVMPEIKSTTQNQNQPASKAATTQSKTMTVAEVATHNTETSCYVSYQKEVYDLTNFIGKHGGGEEPILKNCGKNVDNLSAIHPGGNFSSPKVQSAIKSLVVGVLE
jgi:Cytochrome b5-like Heme/Steroid binding domain